MTDTGHGIPRHELLRVLDPFYTTKSIGTGLGRSVVHSIVQEHGGQLALDSEVGRGTTVRVRLPATQIQGLTGEEAREGVDKWKWS